MTVVDLLKERIAEQEKTIRYLIEQLSDKTERNKVAERRTEMYGSNPKRSRVQREKELQKVFNIYHKR